MIKHIIFDCFGTLIDTGTGSKDAVEQILRNVGSDADARVFYKDWKKIKKEMMLSGSFKKKKKLFEISLSDTFLKYNISADASKEVEPMIRSSEYSSMGPDDIIPPVNVSSFVIISLLSRL